MVLTLTLWLLAPVLQVCLIGLLLRRRAHRVFPRFFVYNVFAVAAEIIKFLLFHRRAAYYRFYWGAEAGYSLLGFLAIYEVFSHLFRSFYRLWWFKFLLPSTTTFMLALAVVIPIIRTPLNTDSALAVLYSAEIAVQFLQVGIFFLIFLIALMFNMYYRQYAFGIAAGLGISAVGTLLTVIFRTGFGSKYKNLLTLMPSVAYDCAVVVWIASFHDFRHLFTPELFLEHLDRYREQIKGIMKL
jgi:hypothetical protein